MPKADTTDRTRHNGLTRFY